MKGTELIKRVAELIAIHGDHDVVIGSNAKVEIADVVGDHKSQLVSASEATEWRVFTIAEEDKIVTTQAVHQACIACNERNNL